MAEIAQLRGHSPWGDCPRDALPAGFLLLLPIALAYTCISEALSQSERLDAGTRTVQRVASDADILSPARHALDLLGGASWPEHAVSQPSDLEAQLKHRG